MAIVDPNTTFSPVWIFLNSPLIIALTTALISVGFGGLFASWLAAQWQLRAKRYDFKLKMFERMLSWPDRWWVLMRELPPNIIEAGGISVQIALFASVFETEQARKKVMQLARKMQHIQQKERIEPDDSIADEWLEALAAIVVELGIKPHKVS